MANQEASIEVPVGNFKDLPPPPKTQAEGSKSLYWRAFAHYQIVELKGLMDVGCFELVDLKHIPRGRKIVNPKWVHTYKGDEFGNFIKGKSRLVAKGFAQVQDVDYLETASPTPRQPS